MKGNAILAIWVLALLTATLFLGTSMTGMASANGPDLPAGAPVFFKVLQVMTGLVVIGSVVFLYRHKDDLMLD